ncbi:MAG TPA: hypothetical protein VMQ50_04310 [Casimicrobiaceae bacterium]|nr:hypothetical protein [Casimicrobiaceae bacterium]
MPNDLGNERAKDLARVDNVEALSILSEDAWEDAVDQSDVDYDALFYSARSASMRWLVE